MDRRRWWVFLALAVALVAVSCADQRTPAAEAPIPAVASEQTQSGVRTDSPTAAPPPSVVAEAPHEDPRDPVATVPAEPLPFVPRRVLVIGDSSAAGMGWTAGATEALVGAEFTLDLESCRRLIERSCTGRDGYRPSNAIEALVSRAEDRHDTLVMATGYNDLDEGFDEVVELFVEVAASQGVRTVIWTTYREDVGYQIPTEVSTSYPSMNDILWQQFEERDGSVGDPEFVVMDWWGHTADTPEWLAGDGVHFTAIGSFGFADLISRTLASLDGRPCPMPSGQPGVGQQVAERATVNDHCVGGWLESEGAGTSRP